MTLPACPDPRASGPQWNYYCASGATMDERRARLAQCPADLLDGVKDHVRTVFMMKDRAGRVGSRPVVTQRSD